MTTPQTPYTLDTLLLHKWGYDNEAGKRRSKFKMRWSDSKWADFFYSYTLHKLLDGLGFYLLLIIFLTCHLAPVTLKCVVLQYTLAL